MGVVILSCGDGVIESGKIPEYKISLGNIVSEGEKILPLETEQEKTAQANSNLFTWLNIKGASNEQNTKT